jgi:hypothetical protein
MRIRSIVRNFVFSPVRSIFSALRRWAYNNDGVDDYAVLANRGLNIDGPIDIKWTQDTQLKADGNVIVSQCGTGVNTTQEFRLTERSDGILEVIVGGAVSSVLSAAQGYERKGRYQITLFGTELKVYKNGTLLRTETFTRGTAREPAAATLIGARPVSGGFVNYCRGILRDIEINGVLWPIADRNQTIQLPSPSGLGADTFDYETATTSGSVTKENGYFQFNVTAGESSIFRSQSGSIALNTSYLLEFEIVDYVAGGIADVTNGFTAIPIAGNGKYRHIANSGSSNRVTIGRSGTVCNYKVRNVSVRLLGTCNPMTLVNTSSDRWQEIDA